MSERRRRRKQRSSGSTPERPDPTGAPGGPKDEESAGAVVHEEPTPESPPSPADDPAAQAQARMAELEDRLRRAQADFRNETQRIARQAEENRKFAVESVVRDLLPVFDALHSARQGLDGAGGPAGGGEAVRQGLDLVERQLLDVLRRYGVEKIEAQGAPFDPGCHEALFVVDHDELPPGTVAQVLRPGFSLHGRVVRAPHVAVTRAADPQDAPRDEGDPPQED